MRTEISPECPHSYSPHVYAWQQVPPDTAAHLDFGCNNGKFLASLQPKGIHELVGADVSRPAIEEGIQKFPDLTLMHCPEGQRLPMPDGSFDSITLMDVIEHVHEQVELLRELHRMLKDDGILIVTVPGRHLFSFLDMGNFKFVFPRIHKWHYCRSHSRQEYEQRYVSNPDGLVGDVSARKRWHEHFSRKKLAGLLGRAGFAVESFDGAGFFLRPLFVMAHIAGPGSRIGRFLLRLQARDIRRFASSNLFCLAKKQP